MRERRRTKQIRAVDIGKSNIGVGVVYRGRQANPEPNIAEHDLALVTRVPNARWTGQVRGVI